MNAVTSRLAVGVFAVCAVAGMTPFNAQAVALDRHEVQNATGVCQAALPNFDGQIRKRPTAISNEGTKVAFVSCSLVGDAARPSENVLVRLTNNTALPQTVNCTLIEGTIDLRAFFVKSVVIPAATGATVEWTAVADNAGIEFAVPNVQCSFMPGVELDYVERNFKESVAS